MNVILIEDVKGLGTIGEKVKVKDGYARNYLMPKKLAVEASPAAQKVIERKKKERALLELKLREESQTIAQKLAGISPTISMEAGEEEKLFGSVTSDLIAESLRAEGIDIDRRKITLEEPIKKLGVYDIDIKLHPEVKAQVRIWVVKK